ncbi:MAG: response regulator [Promethearchaeota archaeon]|jgi:DNA-binding response OmpR family regulator
MENKYNKIDFLIIEDDSDTVNLLKTFITSQGYSCEGAGSVKEGLEFLNNNIPSVILLDLLLPDKKGHELIKPIKSNLLFKDVLIFFLTAIPRPEALEIMEKYGVNGVITKPFDIKELESLFKLLEEK